METLEAFLRGHLSMAHGQKINKSPYLWRIIKVLDIHCPELRTFNQNTLLVSENNVRVNI